MYKKAVVCGIVCLTLLCACDKHDPILPGVRTSIFDTSSIQSANTNITSLPETAFEMPHTDCPYRQDTMNTIWNGERKIFTGFPTTNSVKSDATPICSGKYIYAGLTTGELLKINTSNNQIVWIADIYRPSNMMGGTSVVDIVAPIVVRGTDVYAGGLGDAFCKINANSGAKKWCTEIGTMEPFIIADNVIFVVASNNKLYALRDSDGAVYWDVGIKKQSAPKYNNGTIIVGREHFDGLTGEKK